MSYDDFLEAVKENIQYTLGDGYDVFCHEIVKNNAVLRKTIVVAKEGEHVSPSIHMQDFYEDYLDGKSTVFDIGREIVKIYRLNCDNSSEDAKNYDNFDYIKDKLAFKLINAKANEKTLEEVPWLPFLDLAIVFYAIPRRKQTCSVSRRFCAAVSAR